jgi:eukaryotic-like serine/threonine-protein kinase
MSGESPILTEELLLEQGTVIAGKYVLERPAGFGGMAKLWVATNQATRAEVCVKIFVRAQEGGNPADHPSSSSSHEEEAIERFRREAHAAANLSHRAIVRVFDLIEIDVKGAIVNGLKGQQERPHAYVIVMELLHGETLGDTIAKKGKISLEETLDIFLPVVSALAHAHRASVVHRDMKPDNIFLARDPDGHVIPKVLDFGVSKISNADAITIDGILVGTPSFMSPEQARGVQTIDARSDVFSAGTLFYMMLTGANPFEESSFSSTVDAVIRRQVPPLGDIPAPIWDVLSKALEKDPMLRFGDATEMGIALRKACGRKGTESNPMMPLPPISTRTPSMTNEVSVGGVPSSGPISAPLSTRPRRGPSQISIPPNEPSSSSTGDFIRMDPAQQRRRSRAIALAAVGLGTAVILLIAATMSWMSKPSSSSSSSSSTQDAKSAKAAAAPSPSPSPSPSPTLLSSSPPPSTTATTTTTDPAPPTPSVSAAPKREGRKPRKPGEEPNKARDPGF